MYVFMLAIICVMSLVLVKLYITVAKRRGLIDIPNARSSHVIPTPRGGGLVFIVLWLVILVVLVSLHKIDITLFGYFFLPTALIAVVSFLDDNMSLSAKWRFSVQICAGLIALFMLNTLPQLDFVFFSVNWAPLNELIAILFIVWSINLFNFMDGTDGIASVQAIVVLGGQVFLILLMANSATLFLLSGLCAAIIGFLVWNWPKAKVFMGDVGSASLGLIIALTALWLQKNYHVSIMLSIMLYGIFLFDATTTLIRRILHKEKWYEAHKSHAYQRVHQIGHSHLTVVLGVIVLNAIVVSLVVISYYWPHLTSSMALLELVILCILYFMIEQRRPMYPKYAKF